MRAAIVKTLIASALICVGLIGGQSADAQTAPPYAPTLPANTIGRAALISPSQAATFYAGSHPFTDELAVVTGINPTPTPPEIVEMARALKNNVDLIYQYVRNNIQVSWMYGLQKGALGAMIDKAGTPFDQVDLMVKLLRQAGYTANYVSGTVTLTGAQFTAWTGISDSNGACQLLANGGIPGSVNGATMMACATGAGSSISSVAMSHIWVQVSIPGSSCSSNCLFDPSYKPYAKIAGINLATATGLIISGTPLTTATTNMASASLPGIVPQVNYVKGLNSTGLNTLVQSYAQSLLNYMYSNNLQAAQMEDIVGGGVITPDTAPTGGWRQTTLPYTTSVSATWTGGIPDLYRTTLAVNAVMWNYNANGGIGGWDNPMFPTATAPFFVDQIYGRAFSIDTDWGVGMNINGHSQFNNQVYLRLDGVTLATYTDNGVNEGLNNYGAPIIATARGAPSYVTLTANHPYAASADGSANIGGTYMDTTITRQVRLITPLTIVDGFGDTGPGLFTKWADEKAGDSDNPWANYACSVQGDQGLCGSKYPGGTGDFGREKAAANWLGQYTRAAHLHAAISGSAVQLHHELGFVYADNYVNPDYPTSYSLDTEMPMYSLGDNFDRMDVDSGMSLESRTADPVARRATIQAISASSAALEGSISQQMNGLPDSSSTATRFEWGNAPPGTAGNWDAPSCNSHNAYEDPGCPGARDFVQYTSSNYSQATNVALIEHQPDTYYTSDPIVTGSTQQPIMGLTQAANWNSAYSNEIAAYANCNSVATYGSNACGTLGNVPFTVTTSQETFLGPGQRGGALQWWTGTVHCSLNECENQTYTEGYNNAISLQRGPAFVATAYDANGDPLAIAHDLVSLDSTVGGEGSSSLTKGGGGGNQPDQQLKYSPADAGDILKARFVDKSNALGVNLSNGTIGYTAPAKLDEGNGGFPYELTADFEWHPGPTPTATGPQPPIAPRPGWTTNWNNTLAMSGSGLEAMGKSDVRAAVGTIAAFLAEQDIYKSAPSTQRDVAAVLTQAWWARQLNNNVVTATLGTSSRQFVSLPQGVTLQGSGANWISTGAGGIATLTMTNAPVAYEQICQQTIAPEHVAPYAPSRGWDYTGSTNSLPVSFTITNANGDQQNFTPWSATYGTNDYVSCGFAEGFALLTWTFPQGVTIHFNYQNTWLQRGGKNSGFPELTQVYNTFGTSLPHVRTISFTSDADGNITGFSGSNGRSVSLGFNYDVIANSVTDAAGALTSFAFAGEQFESPTQRPIPYENLFQIYTADNPNAPNTEYDYDSLGHVKDVLDAEALQVGDRGPYEFLIADGTRGERDDPLGDAWSVTYDTYGHPATYQDEDGNITFASADGRGRISQYVYPEGDCEVFGYDDHNNTTSLTKVDKTSLCNVGAGSTHVISVSATWDQTWNKPLTIKDALNNTTTFTYYQTGNGTSLMATAVRPPVTGGSPTYTFSYDAAGKLLTSTDPVTSTTSITTQNTYDPSEQLASTIVDPSHPQLALTTSFGYDTTGNLTLTVDPRQNSSSANGETVSMTYDNDRRKLETDHHAGVLTANLVAASRIIPDVLGRDVEDDVGTVFSGAAVSTWVASKKTTYTPTSKVATITDGDNRLTSTTYDGADRINIVTDPVLRQTQMFYDAAGNTLQEIRGLGTPNQITYATYTYANGPNCNRYCGPNGGDGEKLTVADADGSTHVTTYDYDYFNRLYTTTFADNTLNTPDIETLGYDANSNILSRTNRAQQNFIYTYDVLNRPWTKVVPTYGSTPANTITTAYDLGGRVTGHSDTIGNNVVPGYDTAGRMNQMQTTIPDFNGTTSATLTTQYGLDANGNRTKLTWPDGYYVNYAFDTLNRMSTATDSGSVALATYTWDPYSRRTNLAYANGASITYGYTPGSDLTSLVDGFVTTTKNATYTLGYTNAHQLQSEGVKPAYEFEPPTTASTGSYAAVNTINQYATITPPGGSPQTITYDGNANLKFDGLFTYTYDPENHLMTANKTGMSAIYAYDPEGRRETKTANSTVTEFLNDGTDLIAEYDNAYNVLRRYVPGPAINEPIAFETCPGSSNQNCTTITSTTYFHTDHHGSVVAMSESNGNPATGGADGPFTYDPYGGSNAPLTGVPFRFVGMYLDAETGLYYDRARYYSPNAGGRFLQTDPVGYKDDLDMYSYVKDDPIGGVDPTGLDTVISLNGYSLVTGVYGHSFVTITDTKTGRSIVVTSGQYSPGNDERNELGADLENAHGSIETQRMSDWWRDSGVLATKNMGSFPFDAARAIAKRDADAVDLAHVPYEPTGPNNSNAFSTQVYKDITGDDVWDWEFPGMGDKIQPSAEGSGSNRQSSSPMASSAGNGQPSGSKGIGTGTTNSQSQDGGGIGDVRSCTGNMGDCNH